MFALLLSTDLALMEDLESQILHLDPKVDLNPELKVHADAMAIHNILALLVQKLEIV